MNKLICDFINLDSINLDCYGFILNSKLYSTSNYNLLTLTEIKKISNIIRKNNKKVFVNVDRIIPQNEVFDFLDFVKKINNYCDYIIYSDYSILSLELDTNKLIYNPLTLVCSKEELNSIDTKCIISQELSLNEIKTLSFDKKYTIEAFGYRQMMYSRRQLLSLCVGKSKIKTNKLYKLKEETRDNYLYVYESLNKDNYSTYIYNSKVYALTSELKDLYDSLEFIKLNLQFLDNEKSLNIVSLYSKYLNNFSDTSLDELTSYLNDNFTIDRGFLDKESVLLKDNKHE